MKNPLIYLALLLLIIINSTRAEIFICESGKTNSLQYIFSKAARHDTILLKKGIYPTVDFVIDKPITILNEGHAVLDGQSKSNIIIIQSDSVNLVGLHLKNSGASSSVDHSGIRVEKSKFVQIINCTLSNTFFGVYLASSANCVIKNNNIASSAVRESYSGNGVHVWKSDSIYISGNTIEGHRDGIYFEFVTDSEIINNLSRKNLRYGLHFMFSNGNSYISNTFEKNGAGVAVMYTKNIIMKHNKFKDNWGPASYGILLKDISHSEISGNYFNRNTVAVFMEGSSHIQIHYNTLSANGWAMKILGNCNDNVISYNNFHGNTFDLMTNSTSSQNTFVSNFWDKYQGYDLDQDYFGDIPFRPVSAFGKMTETTPFAAILLRSFMVELLDKIERILPSLHSASIIDEKPLMKPLTGIRK
jgi:nitrous oxidase accessory protein